MLQVTPSRTWPIWCPPRPVGVSAAARCCCVLTPACPSAWTPGVGVLPQPSCADHGAGGRARLANWKCSLCPDPCRFSGLRFPIAVSSQAVQKQGSGLHATHLIKRHAGVQSQCSLKSKGTRCHPVGTAGARYLGPVLLGIGSQKGPSFTGKRSFSG